MKYLIVVIFYIFISFTTNAQKICDSASLVLQHTNICDTFTNITLINFPIQYQKTFQIAVSGYPDVKLGTLIFKEKKIRTTLNVRSSLGSLIFRNRYNRKYVVRINCSVRDSSVLLSEVPYLAQIGLFGHELAHIKDYQNRSALNMLLLAGSYLWPKKREKYEKSIDISTIQQGLGCYLLEWSRFVQYWSKASQKYKKLKRDLYLEPHEILDILYKSHSKSL